MIESSGQFVDRVRAKGISHLWAIEGNPNHTQFNVAMVGDIRERLEPGDLLPLPGVKELGYLLRHASRLTLCQLL